MSLTYGYDLKEGDKILEASVQVAEIHAPLVRPGATLVNHLPFCAVSNLIHDMVEVPHNYFSVRHIPPWVPYLSYEPLARIVRELSEKIRNEPIDFVKNALVCGDHPLDIHFE
jgi:hypothetical protein